MEGGNALARNLLGEVNPSGKLTTTWCKKLEDMPDNIWGEYPGKNDTVRFKEGIMVGYRYFDTYRIKPQFEFGFGLSYTSFEYSDLDMNPMFLSLSATPVSDMVRKLHSYMYINRNAEFNAQSKN